VAGCFFVEHHPKKGDHPMNGPISAQQLAEKLQQAFASGDPANIAALYAEDAVLSENSEVSRGREAIQASYAILLRAFPDTNSEFWNKITCGETFILEGTWQGTHSGPLATPQGDIPPTGRTATFKLALFAQMNAEGLIQEERMYYDSAQIIQQLGLG
jgi:steroid delta-isomerase-like uncharacterized protein